MVTRISKQLNPNVDHTRPQRTDGAIRVARVIARLNIGGPAQHAIVLTEGLQHGEFESRLLAGRPTSDEGNMGYVAEERNVDVIEVPSMDRRLHPWRDLVSLWWLFRWFRRYQPSIVHTHTAKAGAIGRIAAWLAGVPIRVHTFHGHVLDGYFSPRKTWVFVMIERLLARITHRILTVSARLKDELVHQYHLAPSERIEVMPLGLDLKRFFDVHRQQNAVAVVVGDQVQDQVTVAIVGRLVPIKGHEVFLEALTHFRWLCARDGYKAVGWIVGDGELRSALERRAGALELGDVVQFLGWRRDLEHVYSSANVVTLTSWNEGTPVSLIEAMAAGRPVVATRAGGVADLVREGETGWLVDAGDSQALARAWWRVMAQPEEAARRAAAAREWVRHRYAQERLVTDMRDLYRRLSVEVGLGTRVGVSRTTMRGRESLTVPMASEAMECRG